MELFTTLGNEIYYTIDGSIPTYQSIEYKGPIEITDRSKEENIYRNIKNNIEDWLEDEDLSVPVEKGTIVRAISVDKWGNSSDILTETYFIEQDDLLVEDTCIVSLVADPEELFGRDGIYVTGKKYDMWYLSGKSQKFKKPEPNFSKKIEIEGNLEIFENRKKILNQPVGIRIRGASSRRGRLKTFNIFSREEYSGSDVFATNLYENVRTHSIMLEPLGMYVMAADILSDRDIATQKSHKVKVFLDGEFWYDIYMMERYDQEYFKQYYNVKNVVLIEERESIKYKKYKTGAEYEKLIEWIDNADFTDDEQWELLEKRIDIQSYIDYIVANIYLCNIDFSADKNYRRWYSEDLGNTFYEDGRMRWAIYDLDLIGEANRNTFSCASPYGLIPVNENPFYRAFYVNEDYRKQFVISFMDMANNNFSPENMESVLSRYGLDLSWNDNFFLNRYDYITAFLAEEFKLSGTLEPIEISINDEAGGRIIVNTSTIKFLDGSWEGKYFTDYPITITAIPSENYRFVGWDGDVEQTDEAIKVSMEEGVVLRAVFEKVGKDDVV